MAVTVKELNKTFVDIIAVNGLGFEISNGECLGLLGPNGAGKSTAMSVISGKAEADDWGKTEIRVFGYDPRKEALQIKALSGIVSQQDNLDTELSVKDNLAVYAKFYGIPSKIALSRIKELLSFMELQDKAKARINELSGGMQRRLTIARALLNKPRLLILDEPTTGLDPQVRHMIWNKIRELQANGVTLLISTHYMEEAFQICNRIIIMDKGRKVIEGKPQELLKRHIEKYVVEIMRSETLALVCPIELKNKGMRTEVFQGITYIYSNDNRMLSELTQDLLASEECTIRPCNLEDLFLKITGRVLNEQQ